MHTHRRFPSPVLPLLALLALPAGTPAQPPAALANPLAPTLAMPVPLGIQRGSTLDLTLTGTNLASPTGLWTSFPAKVTIPTDANNGKETTKLRVRLEVPKDALLGFHSLRLATAHGISNFRLFCVDDLPQVMAVSTNRNRATPQAVPVPCVVVGKADVEVSDYYKVSVKAGQRLSFEILGRRLGSAFDPQITLFDAKTQKELAYNNDAPGLQTDARLTYTFKDAGDYLVEVRDVMYRGGPDYWYRLRIGDFPCATTPVPMAARRGSKVAVHFAGPNVEGVAPVEVTVPSDPAAEVVHVAPRGGNGLHGWPVALAASDLEEVQEQEPNNEPAKANRVPVPCGITGRFQEKGDVDHYVFAAKKGQRWIIQAQTHEYHSPTDVYMTLKNAAGAQLAVSNPAQEPRLDYTAPADGDLVLAVEHLNYWGGPDETYHLTITPYQPGFDLALSLDRLDVPQGGQGVIPIQTVTRRDYTGPIELSLVGPAFLHGRAVLHPGPAVPNQPAGWLFVSADANAPPGPQTVAVRGTATINGQAVTARASTRTATSQALANLPFPPLALYHQVGAAVTEKPPFSLAVKHDAAELIRGTAGPVTVTATRSAEFTEEIALTPVGLPANVAAALKSVPKGQNEAKGTLTPAANAPLTPFMLSFVGKAKHQGKDYIVIATPASLEITLPFTLQIEPAPLKLTPGDKAKLKVTAVRKGGYAGPISLELRNLPANVTAAKATIAQGQTATEIDVTAAPTAAAGDKAGVNVLGTATAAANQQNASPDFTVSVGKK